MAISKLTIATFSFRRARVALTVAAIALSVSLVVAVTSGYASVEAAVFKYFVQYMGATDVELMRQGDRQGAVGGKVIDILRQDPDVEGVVGRLETNVRPQGLESQTTAQGEWFTASLIGVRMPEDVEIQNLKMERGTTGSWFTGAAGDVTVIDQEAAKALKVGVGDAIVLPAPNKQLKLKVVGIVHKPAIMAMLRPTIYVPLQTLQAFVEAPGEVSRILIDLKPGVDSAAFAARWKPKLVALDPLLKIKTAHESHKEVDRDLQGVRFMSYLGGTVSMLAAAFIVFSTLSMGVTERQRMLAMLRAVGALRWQIASLVVVEGILLAGAGAVIGVPLGYLWVRMLAAWRPQFFQAGVVLSLGGVLFGSLGSVLTALAASLLPAWNAMRVDPIEGMTAAGKTPQDNVPLWSALAGTALMCIDAALVFLPRVPVWLTFYGHFALGLPGLMIGGFLLAPALVWIVEKSLGPAVASALRVKYPLLVQQLSGHLWRAAGTAAALAVGLSVLVVMHTQGNTLLNGWRLPNKFPDMFIFAPFGLTAEQLKIVQTTEGIRPGEVLPIAVEICRLGEGFLSGALAALMPDSTMFLGVQPDLAMKMMELDFREGNATDAARLLNLGRHLIVTEEFRQLKGYHVGSKITLNTPKNGRVQYEVAAVVWSPGIDVFVTMSDMGMQFEERSAASVFGSLEDARRDFGTQKTWLMAANLNHFVERKDLEARVRQRLGGLGLVCGDVREIKFNIDQGFRRLLLLLSTVALSAIAVASLGVTNTVIASIRSRRWQLGILGSIGVTRMQMLRLILAEALLLGLVACVLGVGTGLLMSVDANQLGLKLLGYGPPIDVPWRIVGLGVLIILGVAGLASFWPALQASREEPLALLQAGRAAT